MADLNESTTPAPYLWWRRGATALPMRLALLAVAAVWLLGCVWSFEEQTAFATSKQFTLPELLPLVIDGFAVAMAGVAWAASLDARSAAAARIATLIAVAGSAASNGTWASIRSQHDLATIALAVAVPVAANIAFEVLLAELRRQVQRRRGLPAPVAIPYPRLIRVVLAPGQTLGEWRAHVLELTVMAPLLAASNHTPPAEIAPTRTDPATPSPPHPAAPSPGPELATPPDRARSLAVGPAAPAARPAASNGAPAPRAVALSVSRPLIGDRRLDPRALVLAARLDELGNPGAVTGDMVTELLGGEIAPRTGRRLLAQARAVRAGSQIRRDSPAKTSARG